MIFGPLPVVITEVNENEVVVDGNHMLAGQELHFSVEVIATREATLEEMAHGHIHTEGYDRHKIMMKRVIIADVADIIMNTMNITVVVNYGCKS